MCTLFTPEASLRPPESKPDGFSGLKITNSRSESCRQRTTRARASQTCSWLVSRTLLRCILMFSRSGVEPQPSRYPQCLRTPHHCKLVIWDCSSEAWNPCAQSPTSFTICPVQGLVCFGRASRCPPSSEIWAPSVRRQRWPKVLGGRLHTHTSCQLIHLPPTHWMSWAQRFLKEGAAHSQPQPGPLEFPEQLTNKALPFHKQGRWDFNMKPVKCELWADHWNGAL